jgi:hypothetical protein
MWPGCPEREDWGSDVRCATRDATEAQHGELPRLELLRELSFTRGKQHANLSRILHDVERVEQRPVAIDREAASRRTLYGGRPSDARRTTAGSSSAAGALVEGVERITSHRKRAT